MKAGMQKSKRRESSCKPSHHTYSKDIRDMDVVWFSDDATLLNYKWFLFIESRICPLVPLTGYKLREKLNIAICCINYLYMAYLRDTFVADSRDNSKFYMRIKVWNALIKAGLCKIKDRGIEGIKNEVEGYVSRYRVTKKLLTILKGWNGRAIINYKLARNTHRKIPTRDAYVNLHTGKKDLSTGKMLPKSMQRKPISFTQIHPVISRQFVKDENKLEIINNNNLNHSWKAFSIKQDIYEPNPCLRQTHSVIPYRCARLVSWSPLSIQNLHPTERKKILIDDKPVTELDYSGFDIRRLYNFREIDPDRESDIYKPELLLPQFYNSAKATKRNKKIVRDFIKTATNICFNVISQKDAYLVISSELHTHKRKRLLYKIIYKIEQIAYPNAGKELVERIVGVHPNIKNDFFKNISMDEYIVPIGNSMMTLGSAIMFEILWQFCKEQKPAVSIHDAILCKRSDRKFARRVMTEIYQKWCAGFKPVIKEA